MADIFDFSATAANNTTIGGINTNTGMSPGNVDNVFRELAAIIRNTFSAGWQGLFAGTTSGIPVSNGAGTISTKAAPTGDIVGTSDTQTLTNKTLTSPNVNGGTFDGSETFSSKANTRTALSALGLTSSTLAANSVNTVLTLSDGTSLRIMGGVSSIGANTTGTLSFGATFGAAPVVSITGAGSSPSNEGSVSTYANASTTSVAIVNSGPAASYNWFAVGKA